MNERTQTASPETDHLGFLLDATCWTPDWCLDIASQQGLSLTDQDMAIVESLMQRFGESPARMLALLAGLPKPKNCL